MAHQHVLAGDDLPQVHHGFHRGRASAHLPFNRVHRGQLVADLLNHELPIGLNFRLYLFLVLQQLLHIHLVLAAPRLEYLLQLGAFVDACNPLVQVYALQALGDVVHILQQFKSKCFKIDFTKIVIAEDLLVEWIPVVLPPEVLVYLILQLKLFVIGSELPS